MTGWPRSALANGVVQAVLLTSLVSSARAYPPGNRMEPTDPPTRSAGYLPGVPGSTTQSGAQPASSAVAVQPQQAASAMLPPAIRAHNYQAGPSSNATADGMALIASRWTARDPMPMAVFDSAGSSAGGWIVVTGGFDQNLRATNVIQLYNLNKKGWRPIGTALAVSRARHAQMTLKDGRVLVVGGVGGSLPGANRDSDGAPGGSEAGLHPLDTAEVFDPIVAGTTEIRMSEPLVDPTLHMLSDGRVAVVGGEGVRLFDPKVNDFTHFIRLRHSRHNQLSILVDELDFAEGGEEQPNASNRRQAMHEIADQVSSDDHPAPDRVAPDFAAPAPPPAAAKRPAPVSENRSLTDAPEAADTLTQSQATPGMEQYLDRDLLLNGYPKAYAISIGGVYQDIMPFSAWQPHETKTNADRTNSVQSSDEVSHATEPRIRDDQRPDDAILVIGGDQQGTIEEVNLSNGHSRLWSQALPPGFDPCAVFPDSASHDGSLLILGNVRENAAGEAQGRTEVAGDRDMVVEDSARNRMALYELSNDRSLRLRENLVIPMTQWYRPVVINDPANRRVFLLGGERPIENLRIEGPAHGLLIDLKANRLFRLLGDSDERFVRRCWVPLGPFEIAALGGYQFFDMRSADAQGDGGAGVARQRPVGPVVIADVNVMRCAPFIIGD